MTRERRWREMSEWMAEKESIERNGEKREDFMLIDLIKRHTPEKLCWCAPENTYNHRLHG